MTLYDYRELIKNLVISDLKAKYSSSVLGFAWSMINPLFMMIILFFVFNNVFKAQAGPTNYALYILIGLIGWRFFSIGTLTAMNSIVGKPSLVSKVFIPRKILTLSTVLSNLISSTLEFIVLFALIVVFSLYDSNVHITLAILLFPVVQLLYFVIIYGVSLMLSSTYVYYRDLNQIWDVLLQAGIFLSPVVYPLTLVPDQYMSIYMLNPLTRLINMYRDIFLDGKIPTVTDFTVVALFGLIIAAAGTIMFDRLSRRFAEEV